MRDSVKGRKGELEGPAGDQRDLHPSAVRGATVVTHGGDRGWNALCRRESRGDTGAEVVCPQKAAGDEFCQQEAGDDVSRLAG